jgi:Asp-tRNA(Asn)/Glu-tRNA(Gln) amidotransferase C subunit
MTTEQKELYDKFVNYVLRNEETKKKQVDMMIEESAELILALCHLRRNRNEIKDVITEIADIENMIGQMKAMYQISDEEIDNERIEKIKRTIKKHNIDL